MTTENIIKELLDGNISAAKEATESLLYSKLNDTLESIRKDVTDSVYGIDEAKKKKNDDDEEYADKTDKEDDGEGLDPVDAEDSDVDNDGDSDESDDYLKNRRKSVKKSIKKDDEEEEVDENMMLAPKGKGRKAAKALYQDTTTEEEVDEARTGYMHHGSKLPNKIGKQKVEDTDQQVDEYAEEQPSSKKDAKRLGMTQIIRNKRKKNLNAGVEHENVEEGKEGDGRAEFIYGIKIDKYQKLSDNLKSKIKQKWHAKQSSAEKEKATT